MTFEKINTRIENLLEIVPGGFFGLLSVMIGVIGDLIAMYFMPGYSILVNMISDLGMGPGCIFFNIGVFISGIVAVPFDIYLGNLLKDNKYDKRLSSFAIGSAVISSLNLSLVGVFPANQEIPIIFLLHGTFSMFCFLTGAIYLVIFGIFMLNDNERFSKFFSYYGFIIAALFIVVIFTWIPIIEWVANFGIISWTIIMGIYLIYKKL